MIKYFQRKHCESLVNSCLKSYTINWLSADKTRNRSKMLLQIRSRRPAVVFKIMFCKTSQVSLKSIHNEVFFRTAVSSHAYKYTQKDAITGVFQWIYLFEHICSLFHFNWSFYLLNSQTILIHRSFWTKKR